MRHLIPAVLVAMAASAMAADQSPTITPPATDPALSTTSDQIHAVNTICPVCGAAVDAERQPLSVWNEKERSWVRIGVDNDAHADLIRQQPERYTKAARMNSRLSDVEGSSSGIQSDLHNGKEAEIDAMDNQGRAGALEFNQDYGQDMTGSSEGVLPGKEAVTTESGDANRRLGRAGAHEFNRSEQDGLGDPMRGSSSGMEPGGTQHEGKAAEREDVDANLGRAGALEFNKYERDSDHSMK